RVDPPLAARDVQLRPETGARMSASRRFAATAALLLMVGVSMLAWPPARPARSQAPDVLLNVLAGGAKKLNLFMPDFHVVCVPVPAGRYSTLAQVAAHELELAR